MEKRPLLRCKDRPSMVKLVVPLPPNNGRETLAIVVKAVGLNTAKTAWRRRLPTTLMEVNPARVVTVSLRSSMDNFVTIRNDGSHVNQHRTAE
jgi:hypothetical protein